MDKFLEEIKKIQALEKQINEERIAETEKVNKMTNQERIKYFLEKQEKANKFAQEIHMKQKEIVINKEKIDS